MTTMQQTLAILKPDVVAKNLIGQICTKIEANHLKIIAITMKHLTKLDAKEFYAIHSERAFFNDLINFMTSGPVVILALQGENAVDKYRELMGATNPKEALPNTIRAAFASSIEANAVHGSDSVANAITEINYFFAKINLHTL